MNDHFRETLTDYILSGHALLHCPTTEKTRFLAELQPIADALPGGGREVFVWSQATGWRTVDGAPAHSASGTDFAPPDPQRVPQEILDLPENAVFLLKDFGCYLQHKTFSYADVVIAWLSELRDILASTGRTLIFLGPTFDVPPELANDVTTVTFPLPDEAAITQSIRFIAEDHAVDPNVLPTLVSACRGMTQQQVEDRVALALRRCKELTEDAAQLILREKAELIRRSGLLRFREPPAGGLDQVGGNEAVKAHIEQDKACFTTEAQAFGIDPPRGLLLTGIPGCGKTAISLAAAAALRVPLLQFDVGALMSKWVGESEANTRLALQQVEAMAPCVLQLDEVEKGFGPTDGDSGAGMRTFGTLLKWMSERTCPVYVIMTANDVTRLPPEFTRKGRIDEIFGVYLPRAAERREIFTIHLRRRDRDPEAFDLAEVAAVTDGYSGADIEQVVVVGLKRAFRAESELTTAHLLAAAPHVRPLSQTAPERVAQLTSWLDRHTQPAGGSRSSAQPLNGNTLKRRVTL